MYKRQEQVFIFVRGYVVAVGRFLHPLHLGDDAGAFTAGIDVTPRGIPADDLADGQTAVSYTHLDVYKRQSRYSSYRQGRALNS